MVLLRSFLALLIAMVLCGSIAAQNKDRCGPFGGTIYAWHDGSAWVGEGDFDLGGQTRHAKVRDVNTAVEKHGDFWWGTETATFDFGNGDAVDLLTEFTTEGMENASKVFHVNMNGRFANGKGKYKKASGWFTSQGPFGPGVVLPKGKATPPQGVSMFWIGHYFGTVCW